MSFLGRADRHDLGAIRAEGEHLEYSLRPQIADAIGLKGRRGACAKSVDNFLFLARRAAESVADESDSASSSQAKRISEKQKTELLQIASLAEREAAQLRSQGAKGPIPVCIYRMSSGKKEIPAWRLSILEGHERFHAAMRRLESRLGVRAYGIHLAMDKLLMDGFGRTGYEISGLAKIASAPKIMTEELLAVVEEHAVACATSTEECRKIAEERASLVDYVNKYYHKGIPRTYLETLSVDITNRYGSAIGFARAAAQKYPSLLVR